MGEKGWRRKRLETGAVIKEPAEANGEDEVAENGVIDAGEQKRSGMLVGEGKKESTEDAKTHGQPIAEDDVDKTESEGAGQEHGPAGTEEGLITVEKEGTIKKLLRIDGQERVEDHNRSPKQRRAFHKREKKLGRKEANGDAQEREEECVAQQQERKLRPDAGPGNELGGIKGRIVAENQERSQGSSQKVGNRKIGKDAIEDEQGKTNEEEGKLQRK